MHEGGMYVYPINVLNVCFHTTTWVVCASGLGPFSTTRKMTIIISLLPHPLSICNPKITKTKIGGAYEGYYCLSKMNILNGGGQVGQHLSSWIGEPMCFHMLDWERMVHLDNPTIIGWAISGRVHLKSSVSKTTHPSIVVLLSTLILKFPWDLG